MTCLKKLREQGKAYPRSCHDCGLGPCKNRQPDQIGKLNEVLETKTLRQRLENWGSYTRSIANACPLSEEQIEDARKIDFAVAVLPINHLNILCDSFISSISPDEICDRRRMPKRPASLFIDAFNQAEAALEKELSK